MSKKVSLFAHLRTDFSSGLVVFLVALPLCLGIALASGAPPLAGIIAGVIGGIVVGSLSSSHLSVSGPAAGLTSIVLAAITELGAFEIFLAAVFAAGMLQVVLGLVKAGTVSNYIPNNVIEGMLAGIGVIIILKQIPHAFGYDSDFEGDENFLQPDGQNTLTELWGVFDHVNAGPMIVSVVSLVLLMGWPRLGISKKVRFIPAALLAVAAGILLNEVLLATGNGWAITSRDHLVTLPVPQTFTEFTSMFVSPDFAALARPDVWKIGATIAAVASIETLLCIEAADRMDPQKRYTDTNRELRAQGIGNMLSALLGGLPMTSVVVRTSANADAGAKSKMSAIIHGVLLLLCVVSIPFILNKIPLATLAAVLILVGYKLAKPSTFLHFWQRGIYQFLPFVITFVGVLYNLLAGVALGLLVSVIFILKGNMKRAYVFRREEYKDGDIIHIDLAQEVSFLNKAAIKATLAQIPAEARVVIDASDTVYIAHDVLDLIHEFKQVRAKEARIKVKLRGFKKAYRLQDAEEVNKVTLEHPAEEKTGKLSNE